MRAEIGRRTEEPASSKRIKATGSHLPVLLLFFSSCSVVLSDYHLKLDLLRCSLDKLRDTKPRTDLGWFMRLMVGQVPMQLWKHADRMKFKDEVRMQGAAEQSRRG